MRKRRRLPNRAGATLAVAVGLALLLAFSAAVVTFYPLLTVLAPSPEIPTSDDGKGKFN
jgi:hypothetical protein